MVTHIFHLADLHIRAGNTEQARFDEFKNVFERFLSDIRTHHAVKNKSAIVVVSGDVFHHKLRIESPGLKLATQFFKNLGAICPVFIIRGNHDFRQDKPDEPDLIQSLVHLHNVHYIDKTCTLCHEDVGFGVVTIQDALMRGATNGVARNLPNFPAPDFDAHIKHKIALFHGNVADYPVDWFPEGYDCILLGDIHVQQVTGAKSVVTPSNAVDYKPVNSHHIAQYTYANASSSGRVYAYAGSMIQQDFGENLFGHGYLVWDLQEKTIDAYHVHNAHGFMTTRLNVGKDAWEVPVKKNNIWQPLAALVNEPWFPKECALRVLVPDDTSPVSILRRARDDFSAFGVTTTQIVHVPLSSITPLNCPVNTKPNTKTTTVSMDVTSFNTPDVWIEYVREKVGPQLSIDEWKQWFMNPETIACNDVNLKLPQQLQEKVRDRNNKIGKKILEYSEMRGSRKPDRQMFTFLSIEWDWILCFRDNNWFNFSDTAQHDITVVAAKNGIGKTSLLETLCIALYGEGFPSRHAKSLTSSIICQEKPKSEKAQTSIFLRIGDDIYRVRRVFNISPTDYTKVLSVSKETTIDRVIDDDKFYNLYSGKTAVDEWVETYIGDIRAFLMSCMVTQGCDMDFFGLKPNDQKDMLDQALDIETATLFQAILKEARVAHSALVDLAEVSCENVGAIGDDQEFKVKEQELQKEIDDVDNELTKAKQDLEEVNALLHGRNVDDFQDDVQISDDDEDMDYDLLEVQSHIQTTRERICHILGVPHSCDIEKAVSKMKTVDCSIVPSATKEEMEAELAKYTQEGIVADDTDVHSLDDLLNQLEEHPVVDEGCLLDSSTIDSLIAKYGSEGQLEAMLQDHVKAEPFGGTGNHDIDNARKILERVKPERVTIDNTCDVNSLRDSVRQANDDIMILLSNQPEQGAFIQPSGRSTEQIEDDIDDVCSERDIQKLCKLISDLERLHDRYTQANNKLHELEALQAENGDHPFNHECWACQQQPWRKHSEMLSKKIEQAKDELKVVKKQMKKTSGCEGPNELREYIETLEIHVANINELKYLTWKKFSEAKRDLEKKSKTLTAQLDWMEWDEAKKTVDAWEKTSAWKTKMGELENDMQVFKRYSRFILQRRISKARMFVVERDLKVLRAKQVRQLAKSLKKLERIEKKLLHSQYAKKLQTKRVVQRLEGRLVELRVQQSMLKEQWRIAEENKDVVTFLQQTKIRLEHLQNVCEAFDGFKQWVYTEKVIPCLTSFVNDIALGMCETRPLQLVGRISNGVPAWFLSDTGVISPIERASGFQKFVLGLAMRIALGRVGASGIQCGQLFIDEGFTTCDSDNLGRVSMFLRQLLSLYNDGIVLVSHMDDVKSCAVKQIVLTRKPLDPYTQVQVGSQFHKTT